MSKYFFPVSRHFDNVCSLLSVSQLYMMNPQITGWKTELLPERVT